MSHAAVHAESRDLVFGHYGRVCRCCGATEDLSIDDVTASVHPGLRAGGGPRFYRWLIVRGFPQGFQTLCMTCNRSKKDGKFCRIHGRQLCAA